MYSIIVECSSTFSVMRDSIDYRIGTTTVYRRNCTQPTRTGSPDVALISTLWVRAGPYGKNTSYTVLNVHQISNKTFQNVQSCIRIQSTRAERKAREIKEVAQHSSSYWSAINKTFPFWKIFLASCCQRICLNVTSDRRNHKSYEFNINLFSDYFNTIYV